MTGAAVSLSHPPVEDGQLKVRFRTTAVSIPILSA
jgi:hypothetical protein